MGKIRRGNTPVPVRLGRIQHNVPQAFTAVAHLIMAENEDGRPVAFMGKGLGKCLMQYGIEHYKIQELTVNEQNPQAKRFWLPSLQKSEYDQQGRPYPLVSMRRP
jgi:putative acetyltransferase